MDQRPPESPAQTIVDAIIDGAAMAEGGRIAGLAWQGLEEPSSLTTVQARQVFAAFLFLYDPLARMRSELPSPALAGLNLGATQYSLWPRRLTDAVHLSRDVSVALPIVEPVVIEAGALGPDVVEVGHS